MNTLEGPIVLIQKGWTLFKSNCKVIVPVAVFPSIIGIVGQLLILTKAPAFIILGILVYIASIVFSIAMIPALLNAIHRLQSEPGAVVTINSQYSLGFAMFGSMLLLNIIIVLISIGAYSLFIIPGIIISFYISFAIFAFVIDGKKSFGALVESYSLVKGRWSAVFGKIFTIGIVFVIFSLTLTALSYLLSFIFGMPLYEAIANGKAVTTTFGSIIGMVTRLISNGIFMPLALIAMYNIYISLKATRQDPSTIKTPNAWFALFFCLGILVPVISILGFTALFIRYGHRNVDQGAYATSSVMVQNISQFTSTSTQIK